MVDDTRTRLSKANNQLVQLAGHLLGHDEESIKSGEKGCIIISWDWDCMVGNIPTGAPLHKILWAGQEYLDALEDSETKEQQRESLQKLLKSMRRRGNR